MTSRARLVAAWWATVAGIAALSVFGRVPQRFLFQLLGSHRGTLVAAMLSVALAATLVWVARRRDRAMLVRALLLVPLFVAGLGLVELAEERIHFLVFGAFGVLTFALLGRGAATLVAVAVAGGDELLQAALPERYFDVRDIVINSVSALAAGWLLTRGEARS